MRRSQSHSFAPRAACVLPHPCLAGRHFSTDIRPLAIPLYCLRRPSPQSSRGFWVGEMLLGSGLRMCHCRSISLWGISSILRLTKYHYSFYCCWPSHRSPPLCHSQFKIHAGWQGRIIIQSYPAYYASHLRWTFLSTSFGRGTCLFFCPCPCARSVFLSRTVSAH